MGKRKERRIAAMSAASRRVKLDLFAEPSGDLGGSPAQGEVGGDDKSKNHAGSPNSPSSSGQPPENPLSLLGQYSDDDVDVESSELANHTMVDTSPADVDNQVNMTADKEYEDTGMNSRKGLDDVSVEHIENGTTFKELPSEKLEGQSVTADDATESVILHKEPIEDISAHVTSSMQANDTESSDWKMVLHEESNQYYYWNILTGETSWDVPDVLAQQTQLTSELKGDNDTGGKENVVTGIHESNSIIDINFKVAAASEPTIGSNLPDQNFKMEEILQIKPNEILDDNNGVCDVDQVHQRYSHDAVCASHELSLPQKLESNWEAPGADPEKSLQYLGLRSEHKSGRDLCSHLLSRGECLLERLNTLKGSKGRLIGRDKITKYTVEVEIRLSDIKSLSSHASSLLPFWLHCENKFAQLESAVSDEVLQFYESVEMNDVEANEDKVVFSTSEHTHDSHNASVPEEVPKEHKEVENNVTVNENLLTSVEHVNPHSESNPRGNCEAHEVAVPDELTATAVVHSEEDVDMDVEMELEDVVPATCTSYAPPEQQPVWTNTPAEHDPSAAEGAGIPPPPDEDWIPPPPPDTEPFPPPPPDNEPFPPPPPDDLPESSYPMPLPVPVTAPSFTYTAQYNQNYPGSTLEYYGQSNAEIQENNYYVPDPNQLSVALPSYYYEATPNVYPVTAPAVADPSEPGSYHGLQDETVPPVPGVTNLQSSHLSEAGQGCLDSDHSRSSCIAFPVPKIDASIFKSEPGKKSDEALFAYVSDQVVTTPSVTQDSLLSSMPAVTVAAAVPKVQPKVSRNKKRTTSAVSTLKSNKKVSSLVDKWKAAKEELHEEEEDEPENAYEILEKKRQREIEEWRAKQIASGEAKDNANFQPLGGDWRERVKRKRARLVKNSAKDLSEKISNGNEALDLDKLSRELPSGWQAYWDDSSKQVYYANSITSETTWSKPS